MRFVLLTLLAVLVLTPSTAATTTTVRPVREQPKRVIWANNCKPVLAAVTRNRLEYLKWEQLNGHNPRVSFSTPRGCAHARWVKGASKQRALQAHRAYRKHIESLNTLHEKIRWLDAVQEAQKAYPGTSGWLISCSKDEGGWGRWFPNSQGSGAGGWLQFMESTFWRMHGASRADVLSRGYKLDRRSASWHSPIGQAIAGGWAATHGATGEWSGRGC